MIRILSLISKKRAARQAFKIFCTPAPRSKKSSAPIFEKAESLSFQLEDKTVTGYRWNHPQPKKLLIIHGFHSYSKKFERFIVPMIKKGYEVVAFDAPAHGQSEGRQVNVLQYTNMISEAHKRYGPFDAFLAHSFGGMALSLALENMPHSAETKVVLIAAATESRTAVDQFFKFFQFNDAIRREFENLILAMGGYPVEWYSVARAVSNITATMLWIHDEDDDITPIRDMRPVMEARHPNIHFMITHGLGHGRIYGDEKVMNAVSDFF